ncbi:MAG: zinc ribbon domain-containing protein [Clostridia bacterium]|nr:zinc ribbon domain-containing protein [Clostridia bacterium]
MGFLERAIRRGVSEGIGKAVGQAITKAVEPTATELANKAAQHFDNAAQQNSRPKAQIVSGLEGAFANLERAAQGYATEMSKNIKVCPNCNQPSDKEKTFCPSCGTKLPETTVSEGAVCTECNKQNPVGAKFCDACGAKLPAAIAEEQAQADRNAAVIAEWDTKLPQYPKWNCGGKNYCIEDMDGYIRFSADFEGNRFAAEQAVAQYRKALVQNGFIQAGQYPNIAHLYKRVNGVCYHADTEHCFEGDPDCPNIYFNIDEPTGGYDYVKPEPKKQVGLKDLFKF